MRSLFGVFAILSFLGIGADNINFDALQPGPLPPAWTEETTHGTRPARWLVKADSAAPSRPNVLEQASGTPGEFDFPVAIFNKTVCRDGDLSVKFRIDGGRRIRTAGVVWRYQDANNYYLLHFSADQKNIALFRVVNGRAEPIPPAGAKKGEIGVHHDLKLGEWYIAKVIFRGPRVRVLFGNRRLFDATDASIQQPGRTGVWTRGQTLASFDDFRIDRKG